METKELKVQIEQESVDYLQEVFKDYKEVCEPLYEIKKRCIIHIYPKKDTYKGDGELYGYCDALLCEMHIYDCDNKLVYKTNNHDSVYLDVQSGTRIFKDLSTMLIIDGGITISYGTGLSVYRTVKNCNNCRHNLDYFDCSQCEDFDEWEFAEDNDIELRF